MDEIIITTPDLVTFGEAAEILKVSRPTIYNLVKRCKLTPLRIGRNQYLFKKHVEGIKNGK